MFKFAKTHFNPMWNPHSGTRKDEIGTLYGSSVGNTLYQTCFKTSIAVHCERHSSSREWTLTTSRIGIQTPNLEIKVSHNMCILNTYKPLCSYWIAYPCWYSILLKEKTSYFYLKTSTLQPLDLPKNLLKRKETSFPYLNKAIISNHNICWRSWMESPLASKVGGMKVPSSLEIHLTFGK